MRATADLAGGAAGNRHTDSETKSSIIASLQTLKQRDNSTNFKYLAMNYVVFLATLLATLWSYSYAASSGLGFWLTVPATIVAVIIIGGFQHQLGGVVHEATHYTLFADRKRNELIADWFGAFPIYTSTYAFRLHHLAHHQFVNDPERDPNFAQAEESGHWLDFPLTQYEMLIAFVRQMSPVRLVRYIMARARYSAIGSEKNPYSKPDKMGSPWIVRLAALYAFLMPVAAGLCIVFEQWALAAVLHVVASAALLGYLARVPEQDFAESRIDPVISHRATALGRMGFLVILYAALTATCYATGAPAWGYFLLLWLLLFTTFPLFMVAREWFQHGNADRGRFTNSRVFLVNPVTRFLIFPWGMDYHLPHHLYCSVPHYKLKDLHDTLVATDPEYREHGQVVSGVIGHGTDAMPTTFEVLGPKYAMNSGDVSVQDDTLELAQVNDKTGIARHSEASRNSGRAL
jgi:fatty acid desaturase